VDAAIAASSPLAAARSYQRIASAVSWATPSPSSYAFPRLHSALV
jgi:hypothetical protein